MNYTLDAFWTSLGDIGWLASLPEERRASLRSTLERSVFGASTSAWGIARPARDEVDILELSRLLGSVEIDVECVEGVAPYTEILHRLAAASFGFFGPENILERERDNEIELSFTMAGHRYSLHLTVSGDELDTSVIDLVNQALIDAGAKHRFHGLPMIDQCLVLAFAPDEVFERAKRTGIIVDPNDG